MVNNEVGRSSNKPGMRITWRGIVIVVIIVALIVFGVQNLESAQVNFLGMEFKVPVWLLVSGTFILGMLLGGFVKGTARKLRKPHGEASQ
jgi:uncharacterized integral membrane protein